MPWHAGDFGIPTLDTAACDEFRGRAGSFGGLVRDLLPKVTATANPHLLLRPVRCVRRGFHHCPACVREGRESRAVLRACGSGAVLPTWDRRYFGRRRIYADRANCCSGIAFRKLALVSWEASRHVLHLRDHIIRGEYSSLGKRSLDHFRNMARLWSLADAFRLREKALVCAVVSAPVHWDHCFKGLLC